MSYTGTRMKKGGKIARSDVDDLTGRETEVLSLVYSARVATTTQLSMAVWGTKNAAARKTMTELRRRGLIQMQRVVVPDACGWASGAGDMSARGGHAVRITERGIRALVRAGILNEQEYRRAMERQSKAMSVSHMVLVAGARVHATTGASDRVHWVSRWEERVLVRDGKRHVPDGVMVAGGERWAVEVDRGALHVPDLLDRWSRLLGSGTSDTEVPEDWPDGYLWLMTARTADLLRTRVSRLRRAVAEQMRKLPWLDQVRWVVDSYDGALWTWRHWFRPWALGERASPGEEMAWAVVDHLGELPMPLVVTLGDLQMWVRLIRMAEEGLRRVIVVVRDELEAEDLQHVLERRAPMTAALYLTAGVDARSTGMTGLVRYPGESGWRSVPLKSYAG